MIATGEGADVGVGKMTARKRAVGTREHIVAYLAEVHELFDAHGMASTQLAAAVGYPGSSVAFAQLLSGMERSGLIRRDVRGKRTYRISLSDAVLGSAALGDAALGDAALGDAALGDAALGDAALGDGENAGIGTAGLSGAKVINGADGFDYDELARRLLVQLVRRLAAAEPDAATRPEASEPHPSVLRATVTGLEYELASAWIKQGELAEENVRLREELKAAQRSLALAAERLGKVPITTDLDSNEVVVLQRLLG
jgi:uncharacterized protein YjbI with pentapeptide repeats